MKRLQLLDCILPKQIISAYAAVKSFFHYRLYILKKRSYSLRTPIENRNDMNGRMRKLRALIVALEYEVVKSSDSSNFNSAEELVEKVLSVAKEHDVKMKNNMAATKCKKLGNDLKHHCFNIYYKSMINAVKGKRNLI